MNSMKRTNEINDTVIECKRKPRNAYKWNVILATGAYYSIPSRLHKHFFQRYFRRPRIQSPFFTTKKTALARAFIILTRGHRRREGREKKAERDRTARGAPLSSSASFYRSALCVCIDIYTHAAL